jgi:hypothetical protein
MGEVLFDRIDSWAEGIVTSIEDDAIPAEASPRGWNSALFSVGGGHAAAAKRRGMSLMNATAISGTPEIHGQYEYKQLASGVFADRHLLVGNDGSLSILGIGGTITTISASAFTSGDLVPDFATANNLCFIANGTDQKKVNGSDLQTFGIVAPTTAPTLSDAGTGDNHSGTYEGRVTFGNSVTGAESSAGTTSSTLTLTTNAINWFSIPTSSDTQVDQRKLYIRNTGTQANFYLAATISDNTTTTYQTDVADSSLITLGPNISESDVVPSGARYLESHVSRLFAATNTQLHYSGLGKPESFATDDYERVNPDDGQKITAIHAAHEVLIIWKTSAMYALVGDNPQSWEVRLIDPHVGCTSHRSVITVEGLTYWWSEQGPMVWDGAGTPKPIGTPLIAPTLAPDNINEAKLDHIVAAADVVRQRVMFGVPNYGQARNTMILPFSYRLQRWESSKWDPMDVASFGVADDADGQPWVFLGNYAGQAFKWWDSDNDGVDSGTKTGTFTASGTSVTTVTDAGASFDTTGGGLVERKVTILDSNGSPVTTRRPYIASNTGTAFTLTYAVAGLTNGGTYTYVIGGPDFQWDTRWEVGDRPFWKKRYEYVYVHAKSTISAVTVYLDLNLSASTTSAQTKALSFATTTFGSAWDTALWDTGIWGGEVGIQDITPKRIRVGRTGWSWRGRFRNHQADQTVTLLRVAMRAELLTDKLG